MTDPDLTLPDDWDDSEDDDQRPGLNPERLNIEGLELEDIARIVMDAGVPDEEE